MYGRTDDSWEEWWRAPGDMREKDGSCRECQDGSAGSEPD